MDASGGQEIKVRTIQIFCGVVELTRDFWGFRKFSRQKFIKDHFLKSDVPTPKPDPDSNRTYKASIENFGF